MMGKSVQHFVDLDGNNGMYFFWNIFDKGKWQG